MLYGNGIGKKRAAEHNERHDLYSLEIHETREVVTQDSGRLCTTHPFPNMHAVVHPTSKYGHMEFPYISF